MMMRKYIGMAALAALLLTSCDKVSPTGLLIATSDVDDRTKMSYEYYQKHKNSFHMQRAEGGEYTFLVGADSHMIDDTGRMTEMFDIAVKDNDLFVAHLGDIADTKAEYYIRLDSVVQKAKELYVKKHYEPVVYTNANGEPQTYYRDPLTGMAMRLEDHKFPFYPVVGNHDITNNGWALWTNLFQSSFYSVFINVGDYNDKVVMDRFIFLDTASGTLGREQIDLLDEGALEPTDDKNYYTIRHTFVFGHTNIFRVSSFELASTFPREETFYLLDKFDEWDADIVFCGHVHQWDEQEVGGVTYLTLDTMSERNNPDAGDYLVRVTVKKDGSLSWERVHMSYTTK